MLRHRTWKVKNQATIKSLTGQQIVWKLQLCENNNQVESVEMLSNANHAKPIMITLAK